MPSADSYVNVKFSGLRKYPRVGRTVTYMDPVSKKLRTGRVTSAVGGLCTIKGADKKVYTGMKTQTNGLNVYWSVGGV